MKTRIAILASTGALLCVPASGQVTDPYASSYVVPKGEPFAIVDASVLTAAGAELPRATVLVRDGRVLSVGVDLTVPAEFRLLDGRGKWVTPGIIDAHSHLGVSGSPNVAAHEDGNETTSPNTAEVWAEHSVWPQDPKFRLARGAGVTTLLILPGSDNLFNGRSVTVKNVPATTVAAMKFPGAPYGLKVACGENPKIAYGGKGRFPQTRMGNVAGYRAAWIDAADYLRKQEKGDPPKRDLKMETMSGVLKGEILIQNHCYRADEMVNVIEVSHEFGFKVTAFHHASEAYKIAPLLAKEGICVATWAEAWGAKMESFDGIEENAAIVDAAGGCAVIHSDDGLLGQRLNQEAGIALAAGRAAGLPVDRDRAIRWVTANPARMLGILAKTGTIEPGKAGDLVLWDRDPFSVYAVADKVWIDGALVWDRADAKTQAPSDFLVGQPGQDFSR